MAGRSRGTDSVGTGSVDGDTRRLRLLLDGPSTSSYIDVGPVILAGARKHGISDDDMLHAYRNPIQVFAFDELTMLIGAGQDGWELEVGLAAADGIELIVHAMIARRKFLR